MVDIDPAVISFTQKLAPPLNTSYCLRGGDIVQLTVSAAVKSSFIFVITAAIILSNLFFICVINSRSYSAFIHQQPRYLLTCLASNDLALGLLVTSVAIIPALFQCWPFGDVLCQIQALLRGSLTRQSSMILMFTAIDRYFHAAHPTVYRKCFSNNKICMVLICLTLVLLISIFATIVLSRGGFYFNQNGFAGCDIFYYRSSYRVLSACVFYFPTTMTLMVCYGKVYQVNKNRKRRNKIVMDDSCCEHFSIMNSSDCEIEIKGTSNISGTMGIISLCFTVMTTPWTIHEIVVACTGLKVSPVFEFITTWIAFSNSLWNPVLYWLLNVKFQVTFNEIITPLIFCHSNVEKDSNKAPHIVETPLDEILRDIKVIPDIHTSFKENFEKNDLSCNNSNFQTFCPTPPPPPSVDKYWRHLYQ